VHQDVLLGYAYASAHRARAAYQWSVDVSVYIHATRHRSGVGRALYRSLLKLLELQGFYHAYAGITLPNPASVGLHEAMGFRPVGVYQAVGFKLGAWHDVGWWQLSLQERLAAPTPPIEVQTLGASSEWDAALATGLACLRL
jgi:phosphinothricin acetyltransferase